MDYSSANHSWREEPAGSSWSYDAMNAYKLMSYNNKKYTKYPRDQATGFHSTNIEEHRP